MVFWGSPITARYSVFSQWRNSRFYFFSVQLKSSLRSEQVSKLYNFGIIMHYHPCIYLLTLVFCLAFIKTIEGKPKPSFDKYVFFNDLFRHIKLELSKTEHILIWFWFDEIFSKKQSGIELNLNCPEPLCFHEYLFSFFKSGNKNFFFCP